MADPTAPAAPKVAVKLTTKANAPKAAKTFVWSADKKDVNKTFLKGKKVIGFPADLVAKYREAGLIEAEPKKEEEE